MSQEERNKQAQKGVNIQNQKNEGLKEEQRLGQAILDTLQRRVGTDEQLAISIRENNTILADQAKVLTRNTTSKSLIKKLSNEIVSISERSYTVIEDELGLQKTEERILKDQESLEKKILSLQSLKNEQLSDNAQIDADIKREIGLQIKASAKLSQQLETIKDQSKEVANNLSVKSFGGLSDIFSKIPGLSRFSGPFQEAAEASREQAAFNLKNFGTTKKIGKANLEALKTGKGLTADRIKSLGLEGKLVDKNGKLLTGAIASQKANALGITKAAGGAISPLKAGFKALGPIIKKALGPISLVITLVDTIKFFVKSMFEASKATADFSRNLLISREAARELRSTIIPGIVGEFNELAKEQGNLTILAADFEKTLGDINSQLGFQLNLAQDFGRQTSLNVAETAMLQKQFGLSAEAATRLFVDSERLGQPLQEYTQEIFGQVGLLSTEAGLMADVVGLIEEASKISGNLRANFGGSVKEIAAAVYQAKLLGLNLQDTENIANSLLDFEQSIQNELEAEILLGRDLNLERAREAALLGDTATLLDEIGKLGITQQDFLNMNVASRQALAKSIGMEVNQLADSLQQQEDQAAFQERYLKKVNALKKQGITLDLTGEEIKEASLQEIRLAADKAGMSEEQIRDILGEQIYARKQEQDATQKFNQALGQAKEAFARLVTGGLLDDLADILRGITESALFSGFKEEGEASRIAAAAQEADNISESDQAFLNRTTELQEQATGMDDTTDVLGAIAAGAGAGAIAGGVGGLGVGAIPGAVIGGIGAGVIALLKNVTDQTRADFALEQSRQFAEDKGIVTSTQPNSDFISRPGQPIQRFRKDDIIIGATRPFIDDSSVTTPSDSVVSSTISTPQPLPPPPTTMDNTKVEKLLERLITSVEKGGVINMDGNKVGTVLGMGSYRIQ